MEMDAIAESLPKIIKHRGWGRQHKESPCLPKSITGCTIFLHCKMSHGNCAKSLSIGIPVSLLLVTFILLLPRRWKLLFLLGKALEHMHMAAYGRLLASFSLLGILENWLLLDLRSIWAIPFDYKWAISLQGGQSVQSSLELLFN